jgi:hypothetical protein
MRIALAKELPLRLAAYALIDIRAPLKIQFLLFLAQLPLSKPLYTRDFETHNQRMRVKY